MVKHTDGMKAREEEIERLIKYFSSHTDGFENPETVMIGGYALRAFVPFSRYTRDCDFVLKKSDGWSLDRIHKLLTRDLSIETSLFI